MLAFPCVTNANEIVQLLELLRTNPVPPAVDIPCIQSLGFNETSAGELYDLLVLLRFIEEGKPSPVWESYKNSESSAEVLALATTLTYPDLFEVYRCPYLEADETLELYFKGKTQASDQEATLMSESFRAITNLADYQNTPMDIFEPKETGVSQLAAEKTGTKIKVNPNLQLNIEIHIDPHTSDEKIEAIFKNMRKYLIVPDSEAE
jgi:hypothetical protein